MGLIKAMGGAVGGTLADQWLEFFTLDSMPPDVLVTKGNKVSNGRGSNTKGSENIISNGSGIIVADGQAVALVNNGIVVEFASEPGTYTFDESAQPSIFSGSGGLAANIKATFQEALERFKRGGGIAGDQRVYYFNIKEIIGNKYGTAEPIPYRVVDTDIGLDMDVDLRCNGEYSYKLMNPILFYQNIAGNVGGEYNREMMDSQLKAELMTGLNVALANISAQGIRYSALPGHAQDIASELNNVLSQKWRDLRGIEIVSMAVNSVSVSDEDEKRIKDLQAAKSLRDPNMAGAVLASAQADAMRSAAQNDSGSMMGFMGLGMANMAGGTTAQGMFDYAAQQQAQQGAGQGVIGQTGVDGATVPGTQPGVGGAPGVVGQPGSNIPAPGGAPAPGAPSAYAAAPNGGFPAPAPAPASVSATVPTAASTGSWNCPACGQSANSGNFCMNCGAARPAPATPATWTCPQCGKPDNSGNFCSECGTAKA
jgi:membrane protease subunit (stomatin/prohibitin family)